MGQIGSVAIYSTKIERKVDKFYPTIKSPEKDTRQLDLGNAQAGSDTRQLEILKRETR